MQTFETTEFIEARRFRFAQLSGRQASVTLSGLTVAGIVHSVLEDVSSTPKKWIIKIASR
ncbi:hypothetical protein [Nitrobacter sp. TKz-YC02]|uniref:hypothetical protein n=1 Tax=Nitrobacter sp. TKz-YC02 TaxID=3398704 RepID=UPI003CE9F8FF